MRYEYSLADRTHTSVLLFWRLSCSLMASFHGRKLYVCVCVWEKEKEGERERERRNDRFINYSQPAIGVLANLHLPFLNLFLLFALLFFKFLTEDLQLMKKEFNIVLDLWNINVQYHNCITRTTGTCTCTCMVTHLRWDLNVLTLWCLHDKYLGYVFIRT